MQKSIQNTPVKITKNVLQATKIHYWIFTNIQKEFLLYCSVEYLQSFSFSGQKICSFVHKPDLVHSCERDILLCRRKADRPSEWTRVRPLPAYSSFSGPFVLCRGKDLKIKWTTDVIIFSGLSVYTVCYLLLWLNICV